MQDNSRQAEPSLHTVFRASPLRPMRALLLLAALVLATAMAAPIQERMDTNVKRQTHGDHQSSSNSDGDAGTRFATSETASVSATAGADNYGGLSLALPLLNLRRQL